MAAKKAKKSTGKEKDVKTPDYSKKYNKLEKKIGEMSATMDAQREFIDGASRVINTLAYTPKLREAFQDEYKKQQGVQGQQAKEEPVQDQQSLTGRS